MCPAPNNLEEDVMDYDKIMGADNFMEEYNAQRRAKVKSMKAKLNEFEQALKILEESKTIPLFDGRPQRTTVIGKDDITNLIIAINNGEV
jgi:hypothetical protein